MSASSTSICAAANWPHRLIGKLNDHRIHVIVISGYAEVPLTPGTTAVVLQKPIVEAQLLRGLAPNCRAKGRSMKGFVRRLKSMSG